MSSPPRWLNRDQRRCCACLAEIEQAGEHEVGDLLDDGDRVGDPAGVELQPEGVDLGFEGGSDHGWSFKLEVFSVRKYGRARGHPGWV